MRLGITMLTLTVTLLSLQGCDEDKIHATDDDCSGTQQQPQTVTISSKTGGCTVSTDEVVLCTHRNKGSVPPDTIQWCTSDPAGTFDVDFSTNWLGSPDGSGKPNRAPFQDKTNPIDLAQPSGTSNCSTLKQPPPNSSDRSASILQKALPDRAIGQRFCASADRRGPQCLV